MAGMSIGSLAAVAIVFVVAVVLLGVGSQVVEEIRIDQCTLWDPTLYTCNTTTVAYNASTQGQEGVETLGDWLPTIATIAGAAIIITVIAKGFGS